MGKAVFPPCCLTWGQTMLEAMKVMATPFKRSRAHTATPSAPDPAAGHHQYTPLPETPGHSLASLGQYLVGSLFLSSGSWHIQGFVCFLQESVFPVLCKFWWLYGGVNGNLLKKGLCYTQVCCTQSPDPCAMPLLTRISARDTQILKAGLIQSLWYLLVHTRFCLSPLRISGGCGVWF